MAHPEEPTLPEDIPVQRKNKNINNVLHDISRFLLSEIQRRAFRSPRSVKQQEGHGDGRQTGAAGGHAEQHQRDQRRQEAEEAVALLAQLLPEVEFFQAETQRLQDTIAHERRNASFQREINADLRNELKAERNHSFDQSIKLSELERRCKRAERLLSKIPQEELDKLLPKQKGLER